MEIGILHPGQMGAAVAATIAHSGHRVYWLPSGRSQDTANRAKSAGLESVDSLNEMASRSSLILSICPPHAALDVAQQIASVSPTFTGIYVDANAISPDTATKVSAIVTGSGARYVDGGIIGGPPPNARGCLVLSGEDALEVSESIASKELNVIVMGTSPIAASALKITYAAWSKGSSALLLSVRAMAESYGVGEELMARWEQTQPEMIERLIRSSQEAMTKGWRWSGELEEVATALEAAGLPNGFGKAASEIYERGPAPNSTRDKTDVERVVEDLLGK